MPNPITQALENGDVHAAKTAYFAEGAFKAIQACDMADLATLLEWPGINPNAISGTSKNRSLLQTLIQRVPEVQGLPNVQRLIDLGVDLEYRDADGMTALLLAASKGRSEYVQALVAGGANTKAISGNPTQDEPHLRFSHSTLDFAISGGLNVKGLRCLLDAGADPNHDKDVIGTPLAQAVNRACERFGERCVLRSTAENQRAFDAAVCLIHYGADVNAMDYSNVKLGRPILCVAVLNQHMKLVKILLENGADPNKPDGEGWTSVAMFDLSCIEPLDVALMEELLRYGADPNTRLKKGRTLLHQIIEENKSENEPGVLEMIGILIQYGATPHLCDNAGVSALDLASTLFGEDFRAQLECMTLNQMVQPSSSSTRDNDVVSDEESVGLAF